MAKKETSLPSRDIPGRFGYKVRLVGWIVLAWIFLAVCNSVYDYVNVRAFADVKLGEHQELFKQINHHFLNDLMANILGGLLGGLMGGAFLVFYLREKYGRVSYGRFLVITVMAYMTLIYSVSVVVSFAYNSNWFQKPLWDTEVLTGVWDMITGYQILRIVLFWFSITCLTSIVLQINDKFGPGVLYAFMLGRYYKAKPEIRIFMFLDLKSSTTIAERLGNASYHRFLQDFYADITSPILYTRGNIYQYVGDEVVLTWTMEVGVLGNNCLRCFFEILRVIERKKEQYQEVYGYVPQFKAGLHFGEVLTGEVGILKKELVFTGDVLNTTARIQEQCNTYKVPLLMSGELLSLLALEEEYEVGSLGPIPLRGKSEQVALFSVNKSKNTLE